MTRPYSGAYSRRRFSNFEVGGIETDINLDNFKTLSVKWDGSMGNVTGSGNFNANGENFGIATAAQGDTITLTAHPLKGYHFVKWGGGVTSKQTNNPIDIKMATNAEVTAVFAKDQEDYQTPPPGEKPPVGPIGDSGSGSGSGNGGNNTGSRSESMMDKAVPFVKKWWWAILIVGYIVYKEWKGAKK